MQIHGAVLTTLRNQLGSDSGSSFRGFHSDANCMITVSRFVVLDAELIALRT